MLLFDGETEVAGASIYRDHLAPSTFHYLPGPPRIVVDRGRVGLSLTRYRGARTGGLLTLEVDLTLSEAALAATRAALSASIGAPANLVPVLFREGTVRLTALGVDTASATDPDAPTAAPRLVERVLGTTTPSLLGGQRAIFTLELDAEGASLFEASLASAAPSIVIAYDLVFDGLRPARGVRARVDYRMAYDYLRSRATLGSLLFRADLDQEAESLAREGHVTIEDVDLAGADDDEARQRRGEELRATLHELTEAIFFRPATSPRSLGVEASPRGAAIDAAWAHSGRPAAAFVQRELEQHEEQTLAYDLTEARIAVARVAPQGALRLPAGVDAAALIRDVDLDLGVPAAEIQVRVVAPADADWGGVEAITVDVRSGAEVRSVALRRDDLDHVVTLPAGDLEQRARVVAVDDAEALGRIDGAARPFQPLVGRTVSVDPAQLSQRRTLQIALGFVDFAMVVGARGRLVLGSQTREFLLGPERPSISVPIVGDAAVQLEVDLLFADGEPVRIARTIPASETLALLDQPANLFQVAMVALRDPLARYASIVVEIDPADGAPHRLFALDAATPSARWSRRRVPGAPATFRYHTRAIGKDTRVIEGTWRDATGSLLLVGDLDARLETIDVILLGAQKTLGAMLRLTSLAPPPDVDATVEILLDGDQLEASVQVPFQGARRYRAEGTVFTEQGDRAIAPLDATSEVLLLPVSPLAQDPAAPGG